MPPVAVRGQRHDADDPADPIVGKTVAEKRAMAAIVLDHEEADEQARGRHHSHEAEPAVKVKGHAHQGPNRSEGNGRDRKLEAATHVVRLPKAAEQLSHRAGFRPANRIFLHRSATSTDIVQLAARSGVLGEEWVLVCRPIAFNCRRLFDFRTRIRRVVTSKSPGRAVDCAAIRSSGQRALHACTEYQDGKSHLHLIFLFMSDRPPNSLGLFTRLSFRRPFVRPPLLHCGLGSGLSVAADATESTIMQEGQRPNATAPFGLL